jgi:hypothetical protein
MDRDRDLRRPAGRECAGYRPCQVLGTQMHPQDCAFQLLAVDVVGPLVQWMGVVLGEELGGELAST